MIHALQARQKTQTRRLSKQWLRVKKGDLLWVRETWAPTYHSPERMQNDPRFVAYRADWPTDLDRAITARHDFGLLRFRPSIHMPRWASRITLIATEDARAERLEDISEEDARAEGVTLTPCTHPDCDPDSRCAADSYRGAFAVLWNSLHGKDAPWGSGPEVVRVAFEVKA